ncbi:MAG: inositol monophosphatase [Acidimicrobiales bacterium]
MIDQVADIIREVAAEIVVPRFRDLDDQDVSSKAAGELVTKADVEAEEALTARLEALAPGVPVIGEEAVAAGRSSLETLSEESQAWLVDPVDGTANFVSGSGDYAVMVARVSRGETVASWIWQPTEGCMYIAEEGGGAYLNGERISRPPPPSDGSDLRGAALTRLMDAPMAAIIAANSHRLGAVLPGRMCAGVDYPLLAMGEQEFLVFWRTLPWDHAPGVLLVEETGGVCRRFDGAEYRPADTSKGLLVAADERTWETVRELLLEGVRELVHPD